ncbi:MAG: isopenicillin N synthase family oxygenase [Cyanobacteria bacterium]|nr:isopenicillin N synthase family oxygenase [Cyanobacteriota bacterium]
MEKQAQGTIPVVDISAMDSDESKRTQAAEEIGEACRLHGFFYITGHDVSFDLQDKMECLSREFFAQDIEKKMTIRMALGGRAWRGFFPVGSELTSGRPDQKEGIYFGKELSVDNPLVKRGVPLHGANLFPEMPEFKDVVLAYLDEMTALGHKLMSLIAISLGLESSYFYDRYTSDPLILFRIFNYPPLEPGNGVESDTMWSVGEHTDYGILTILKQDNSGGLQVKSAGEWIDAPPVEGSFVCNIGDMLDRMTGGIYRSTPHRVKNKSRKGRLSFPFFFDPNFEAEVRAIDPARIVHDDADRRWDKSSVHEFEGTYGDYILKKVSKVFPELSRESLDTARKSERID